MTVDFSDYFWVRKLRYFTELGVTNSTVRLLEVSLKEIVSYSLLSEFITHLILPA
jgi:hypothetical protein